MANFWNVFSTTITIPTLQHSICYVHSLIPAMTLIVADSEYRFVHMFTAATKNSLKILNPN